MNTIILAIDGKKIEVDANATILDAAQQAGIYVPTLCSHPDLAGGERCGLCMVEVGEEAVLACETKVENRMEVKTATDTIKSIRRDKLSAILLNHPHACLICAQKVGCSRTQCSSNVDVKERCCKLLGNCEVERLVDYVGLREDLGKFVYMDLPMFAEEAFLSRDYNLCIGCGRCVRACRDIMGADALELYDQEGLVLARAKKDGLAKSGCKFCTTCVEVCPTGALTDKDMKTENKHIHLRLKIRPVPKPPDKWLIFNADNVAQVPETEGVFQLLDSDKNITHIFGTAKLRESVQEYLNNEDVCYFDYEEEPMYTARESQLIQQYLQQHGKLPKGNDELDDLF
jgi:predicted molibdopterin-dependent oxidoreductase YjgC